jgi:hypothetical protein
MLRLMDAMATRALKRNPLEFAASVKKPVLRPMVEEFTELYSVARFGGAACDITRLPGGTTSRHDPRRTGCAG